METKQIGLGVLVVLAVALVVGLVLFQAVADNVGQTIPTTATSVVNYSSTGIKDVKVPLAGQELVSVTSVRNATTGAVINAANYTISECVRPSDNLKGICYTALTDVASGTGTGEGEVKITYSYFPDGYIDDAGGRSITGLIVLLTAVGLAMVALGAIKFAYD